jgi:hypothetical protein
MIATPADENVGAEGEADLPQPTEAEVADEGQAAHREAVRVKSSRTAWFRGRRVVATLQRS